MKEPKGLLKTALTAPDFIISPLRRIIGKTHPEEHLAICQGAAKIDMDLGNFDEAIDTFLAKMMLHPWIENRKMTCDGMLNREIGVFDDPEEVRSFIENFWFKPDPSVLSFKKFKSREVQFLAVCLSLADALKKGEDKVKIKLGGIILLEKQWAPLSPSFKEKALADKGLTQKTIKKARHTKVSKEDNLKIKGILEGRERE